MKKTCVVSNVIGNRDVIHNGKNGFVCSGSDAFVKAIQDAQSDATSLTEQAYKDILHEYNTINMAGHYSEIYQSKMGC